MDSFVAFFSGWVTPLFFGGVALRRGIFSTFLQCGCGQQPRDFSSLRCLNTVWRSYKQWRCIFVYFYFIILFIDLILLSSLPLDTFPSGSLSSCRDLIQGFSSFWGLSPEVKNISLFKPSRYLQIGKSTSTVSLLVITLVFTILGLGIVFSVLHVLFSAFDPQRFCRRSTPWVCSSSWSRGHPVQPGNKVSDPRRVSLCFLILSKVPHWSLYYQ